MLGNQIPNRYNVRRWQLTRAHWHILNGSLRIEHKCVFLPYRAQQGSLFDPLHRLVLHNVTWRCIRIRTITWREEISFSTLVLQLVTVCVCVLYFCPSIRPYTVCLYVQLLCVCLSSVCPSVNISVFANKWDIFSFVRIRICWFCLIVRCPFWINPIQNMM